MRSFFTLLLIFPLISEAQSKSLAQFVTWKPKAGMEQKFEDGYKRHLGWHADNGDTWGWYGWTFISGPRAGQFMDATIDHAWADFDHPVNPSGDREDNEKNTEPYADFQSAMKWQAIPAVSYNLEVGLKTKYMKMIALEVRDDYRAQWRVRTLRNKLQDKPGIKYFRTYKAVDGDNLNHWYLLIGSDSWADMEPTWNAGERLMDSAIFKSISSETLVFRSELSRFP
ncbi:hypothetical protein HHL16_21645 [Pseudoflavitalea sp. G-6-1-2]|uniref:hypothetical protein n=1 Tax=Pseudoflavitalea sp. G-6-1-2 TaxID=2728841 RepID=UPI00146D1032|nr:hypothetical protein [Pseudoflavitalea sp. G-6-1-2]NML23499.1 hypothetical protein [Pseudoflavitalea sp. G-6-1-2]